MCAPGERKFYRVIVPNPPVRNRTHGGVRGRLIYKSFYLSRKDHQVKSPDIHLFSL